MYTFADWGNTGQNMAESFGISTVSITKLIMAGSETRAKVFGEILRSKELLIGNVVDFLLMKIWKIYKKYCNFPEL